MKKSALLLAALMLCTSMTFTACAGSDDNDDGGKHTSGGHKDNDDEDKDDKDDDKAAEYVKWSFDEDSGSFDSKFLRIRADFDPKEWRFWDNSYVNGYAETDSELRERLETEGSYVMELDVNNYASDTDIEVRCINASGASEESYAQERYDESESFFNAYYEDMDIEHRIREISFAGATHYCLDIAIEAVQGHDDEYERIIFIKRGDYMGVVEIIGHSESSIYDCTDLFYGY